MSGSPSAQVPVMLLFTAEYRVPAVGEQVAPTVNTVGVEQSSLACPKETKEQNNNANARMNWFFMGWNSGFMNTNVN